MKINLDLILKLVPTKNWQLLAQKRIFFGHQSVGSNIVQGIHEITREYSIVQLNLAEGYDLALFDTPVFAHSNVGNNHDPASKTQALSRLMLNGVGDKVDLVLLKFCYIDINQNSNFEAIFADYKQMIVDLSKRFPKTRFIPVTIPLRTVQTGIRVQIKRLMCRSIGGYADNVQRNRFNDLVRQEISCIFPVFDLATAEATDLHGNVFLFTSNGQYFNALLPAFTDDGGHLNEYGRKIIAARLLAFLSNLF